MIIKIQKSQASSDDTKYMLIYNEDQSIMYEDELDKDIETILRGRDKAYFEAALDKDKRLQILGSVEDQDW